MRKLVCAALGMGIAAAPGFAHEPDLVVALANDIASTEYATKHDDATIMVLNHIMEGLVGYNSKLVVQPVLAESWSVSEDGRTYTFRLRQDVTFHNGARLTARHVKWNFDRFMDPSRDWGSHCREQLDGSFEKFIRPAHIIGTRALDESTFEIRLQSPSAMLLQHLASPHCIYGIVHPDSLAADGSWAGPIGTGPYMFSSREKGAATTLARFAGYRPRAGKPDGFAGSRAAMADRIVFQVIEDAQRRLALLQEGKVDIVTNVDPAIAREPELAHAALFSQVTPAFLQLIPQSRTEPVLRHPSMRQAIAMAVNPPQLAQDLLGEQTAYNPSAVAMSSPYYTEAHRAGYQADEASIAALLAEAGYAGQVLTITTSRDPYPLFGALADAAAERLNKVGIKVVVETIDWASHDQRYANNAYQLTTMAFSPRTDPALMYSAIVGQKGDHPWYLWEDQQAEMWTTIAAVETDRATRQDMFDRLHLKMLEWTPTIGIANYPRVDAVSREVEGYEGWTLAIPRLWLLSKNHD